MSDTEQFLDEMMPRIHEAETALHNGNPGPRFEMWSHTDPVTVFGAAFSPIGWAEVGPMFEKLASNFSNCRSCEWDVVAADVGDDFAYLLAIERTTASVGGGNRRRTRSAAPRSSGGRTATGRSCIATPTRSTTPRSRSLVCISTVEPTDEGRPCRGQVRVPVYCGTRSPVASVTPWRVTVMCRATVAPLLILPDPDGRDRRRRRPRTERRL